MPRQAMAVGEPAEWTIGTRAMVAQELEGKASEVAGW